MNNETPQLSQRETRILQLSSQGHTAKEIGEELGGLSEKAIKKARENIYHKFEVSSCAGAVGKAQRAGIIDGQSFTHHNFRLTARERQIAPLLVNGDTNLQIGRQLGLSELTIKNCVSDMLDKVGCRNRAQLASILLTLKIVK